MTAHEIITVGQSRVKRVGEGTPLVMLHGSGGGLESWDPVIEQLDGFQPWVLQRRGYRPDGPPPEPNTIGAEVDDVLAVLAAAVDHSNGPPHVIGGSYGATLALHAALADPTAVRSLALFEPPLFAAGNGLADALKRSRDLVAAGRLLEAGVVFAAEVARVPQAMVEAFASGPEPDPVDGLRTARGQLCDLEAMVTDIPDVNRWSAVSVPVLLMEGGDTWDPVPATMDTLAGVLPDVRRVTWPGQSHFATHTAPDLFARALRDFLIP